MRYLSVVLAVAVILPLVAATKKSSKRTSSGTRTVSGASNKTASKAKFAKSAKSRSSKKGSRTASRGPARQMAPTPDRYREIQEALAKKGYYQGTPSGVWDQASTDALRRFQGDQKLSPSGKIDSLSLIALGLGPKYASTASAPPPAAPKPAQP